MPSANNECDNIEDLEDDLVKDSKKSDFVKVGGNILTSINYKITLFLFVLGLIIFSDVFIDNVLSKFDDAVSGECTTTRGTLLQLTMLCLGYIIIDLLVQSGWV